MAFGIILTVNYLTILASALIEHKTCPVNKISVISGLVTNRS